MSRRIRGTRREASSILRSGSARDQAASEVSAELCRWRRPGSPSGDHSVPGVARPRDTVEPLGVRRADLALQDGLARLLEGEAGHRASIVGFAMVRRSARRCGSVKVLAEPHLMRRRDEPEPRPRAPRVLSKPTEPPARAAQPPGGSPGRSG